MMEGREPPENLTQLCRLCASNDDVKINIFSDKGREKQLVEKIFSCLSVKISQSDRLPNSLCYKCMTCLENYYDFRCKCLSVISKLELLSNLKTNCEQNVSIQVKTEPIERVEVLSVGPTDYSKTRLPEKESLDSLHLKPQDSCRYTCQECGEIFSNSNEHIAHSKTQCKGDPLALLSANPERPFRCELCHKSYMLSKHLWGHMSTVHKGHPAISCKPCSRTFSSSVNLLEHQRSKHGMPGPSDASPNASSNIPSAKNLSGSENSSTHNVADSQSSTSPSPLRKILNAESRKRSTDEVSGNRRKNSMPRKIYRSAEEDAMDAKAEQNNFSKPEISTPPAAHSSNSTGRSSTGSTINTPTFPNTSIHSNYQNPVAQNSNFSINSKANASVNGSINSPFSFSTPLSTPLNIPVPRPNPNAKSKSIPDVKINLNPSLVRVSPNKDSLMCLLCQKSFSKSILLHKHVRTVHGIDTAEVTLGKVSKSVADDDIENMMEAETVFCCEVCTREFNDRSSMWLHMLHAHKREAGLACGLCLKICSDSVSLAEHVATVHSNDDKDQKRFCCSFCGRQDDARPKLIKHAAVHGPSVNTIEVVISNPRYHTHIQSHNQHQHQPQPQNSQVNANVKGPLVVGSQISCQICYRIFSDEERLIKHCQNAHKSLSLLDHTNNMIFSCELCSSSFSSRSERWKHIYQTHTTDPRIACPIKTCKKVFSSQSLLSAHAATHHQEQGDYPNVCEMCGKLFQQRSEFYKHMMGVHPHTLPFVCGVCLKIVCSIDDLKLHVKNEHEPLPELEEQIRCDICARPYLKHSKMIRHRTMHNDGTEAPKVTKKMSEKPSLNCSLCPDAVYATIEILTEHRKKDHNLMVCDLCHKFYAKCSHLWKHVHRCHPGHPDVTCKICGKTSASRIHLKRHIAKLHKDSDLYNPSDDPHHTPGEDVPEMSASGPHTCEKCKRVFRKYSLLHKHYKHCSGPRPPLTPIPAMVDGVYPCSKCSKSFILPAALRKHIRSTHIPQNCEICLDVSYDTKQELMDHIRENHATDPQLKCLVDGCPRLFRLKADAERHKKEHTSRYFAHWCNFCGDVFTNRKKLRKHLKCNHKTQTQFLCYVCFDSESTLDRLAKHVQESHDALLKMFVCQLCGKNHTSGSKANEHIRGVHGSEYKACNICWKIFTNEKELNTHVENHPQEIPVEKPEPVKKPTVKRTPTSNSRINKELAALTENSADFLSAARLGEEDTGDVSKRLRRMFSCISCTQSFRVVNDLISHRRSIHDEYCCPSCAKQFILEIDFSDHIKTCEAFEEGFVMGGPERSGREETTPRSSSNSADRRTVWQSFDTETPCELCDKVWTGLKHYWQHLIRSHKERAAFACGVCLKLCTDYSDLSEHLDGKHAGNFSSKGNNFVCDVCGRYHGSQGKLQVHMAIHAGRANQAINSTIRCRHCHFIFKTQKFFDLHMAQEHPEVSTEDLAHESDIEAETKDGETVVKDEINPDNDIEEEVESDAENSLDMKGMGKDNEDDVEEDEDDDEDDDDEDEDEEEDDADEEDDVKGIKAEDPDAVELEEIMDVDEDETTGTSLNDEDSVTDPLIPEKGGSKENRRSGGVSNQSSNNQNVKLKELKLIVPNLKINCGKLDRSYDKDDSNSVPEASSAIKSDPCQPDTEINVPKYSEASPCIS